MKTNTMDLYKNHILGSLNSEVQNSLKPHLEYTEFQIGAFYPQRAGKDACIYFILSGIFSLTIKVDKKDTAFVLLGHDNLIDTTVSLDNGLDAVQVMCLTNLTAYALCADAASTLLPALPSLRSGLMTANRNLFMKMARATACSQNHTSPQRLASWLLRASNLTETPRLEISHQGLAHSLGIRRAGTTVELAKLKAANAITTGYGWIEIKDRHVLEQHACSCYRAHSVVFKP